jgi:multiple sugar transport system substrate-binding protein
MFYRKEWLDEQGLVPATTRMEWRTLLEKMTDKEKQRYGYAFRGARGGFYSWWALVEEFAGTNAWFDEHHQCIINRPDHVAGISFWNDLYQDGLTPKDSLNWGYNELVQGFWSGICGSMEQDPEVVRTCLEHGLDENTLSISIMPAGPKARVSLADLGYVSMASGSQRKDKAWEFMSWLMAPEQRLRYCKDVNMIPPFTESINDPAFGQGLYQPFMDMVTDRTMLPNWYPNYLPEMGEFLEVRVTEEHQNMLLKNQSPQETMDRLADFMTKAQKKYVDRHGPDTPRPPEIRRR